MAGGGTRRGGAPPSCPGILCPNTQPVPCIQCTACIKEQKHNTSEVYSLILCKVCTNTFITDWGMCCEIVWPPKADSRIVCQRTHRTGQAICMQLTICSCLLVRHGLSKCGESDRQLTCATANKNRWGRGATQLVV